nr:hypothetical protein [Tanacetum cinerariifolium]
VLVNKSQNKTPYELFNGRTPAIGFLKPFGCHVMILNTLDHLRKFDAKGDKGYFIGYSMSSKAFRVFNKRTKRVEENLHVDFLENKLIEKGAGPKWLFDIDTVTNSINYVPVVVAGTSSTNFSSTKDAASQDVKKDLKLQSHCYFNKPLADHMKTLTVESVIPTVSLPVPTACLDDSLESSSDTRLILKRVTSQDDTPSLDNILNLSNRFEDILGVTTNTGDTNGVEADLGNMENNISASPTPTFRIHKDHPKSQIIGHVDTPEEPKKIFDALKDPSWVEAMQEELLQFKIQNVWILVDCPTGVRPIGTKWVLKNKKDERGIVIRNKARLVAQGHTQEERIDYEEVFAPVARIEAIRLFLVYASFMGFTVYQMDVKSAFLYGTIDEEVYVMQPHGFQNPEFPARVYKVDKAMYRLHQAPRAWYGTLSKYLLTNGFQRALMHEKFQMSAMGELNFFLGLQVLQKKDGIFLSQDKYVGDILKKFGYSDVRSSNTPRDKENPWGKDETGKDVDLHLYRSMIGSLMYLTASRLDIMFAVCACARHQVTPKKCHMYAVKRIFRYLKGHPKLGLWYPKESPFDLVAYSDSDYGGATQDRKSTTGGCQFLGRRLISWKCKKQTIMATSTTKAEYVAAASGCGQVLWIQNQLLDYGFNFMNTKIYIDNNSAICIVKNPVYHYKTKHIEIRHHFIRDYFEKKLISVDHIHTDDNVADLLTKPFDAGRFQIETTDEGTKILATVDGKLGTIFESSIRRNLKLNDDEGISTLPDAELFKNLALMGPKSTGFNEFSSNIATAVSSALPTAADEPASLSRDDSQGEAFPIVSGLEAGQDRENIIKTSALPHDSTPRVTSLAADEGSMQQQLQELTDLCTRLQRQQFEMASKIIAQDLEIFNLKARIKLLEDKDGGGAEQSREDATIKGKSLETGVETSVEKRTERGSCRAYHFHHIHDHRKSKEEDEMKMRKNFRERNKLKLKTLLKTRKKKILHTLYYERPTPSPSVKGYLY